MLKAKAGRSSNWLSSQVAYGMDVSDPEPANWKPFGYKYEEEEAAKQAAEKRAAAKSGPPQQ